LLFLLPLALMIDGPGAILATISRMNAAAWLGVAFQAWPTTLLAFGIWAWLLRQHPAVLIAPFTLLVPVVGMTSAVLLLGEVLTWWKLAGAALVLGGLGLNLLAARPRAER
jgi:O-acetylserine/cysteine efflux transporter